MNCGHAASINGACGLCWEAASKEAADLRAELSVEIDITRKQQEHIRVIESRANWLEVRSEKAEAELAAAQEKIKALEAELSTARKIPCCGRDGDCQRAFRQAESAKVEIGVIQKCWADDKNTSQRLLDLAASKLNESQAREKELQTRIDELEGRND